MEIGNQFKQQAESQDEPEKKAVLLKQFTEGMRQELLFFPRGSDMQAKKRQTIETIERSVNYLYPEIKDETEGALKKIESLEIDNDNDLIKMIAEEICAIVAFHFSLAEIEDRVRSANVELGQKPLNELLDYEVSNNTIRIHVQTALTKKPLELRTLFLDGLRKLAEAINSSDELKNINTICGESWIIFKNPKLTERLGFTVTSLDEEKEVGTAEISRQELLDRYLNDNDKFNTGD